MNNLPAPAPSQEVAPFDPVACMAQLTNNRQKAFVENIIIHKMRDIDAFKKAGYTPKHADRAAWKLKRNPKVAKVLAELNQYYTSVVGASIRENAQILHDMLLTDISDIMDVVPLGKTINVLMLKGKLADLPQAVRQRIKEVKNTDQGLQVKLVSTLEIMRELNKLLGAGDPNVQLNINQTNNITEETRIVHIHVDKDELDTQLAEDRDYDQDYQDGKV